MEKGINFKVVSFKHQNIFISGRYNKYSRQISQSVWIIGGTLKKTEKSVEEEVGVYFSKLFRGKSDSFKFGAAGREDADVRMLGKGIFFFFLNLNFALK